MKWLPLLFYLLVAGPCAALDGEWKLQSMIYKGEPISLPNPDLNLRFTFYSNGVEKLYWDRGGDEFCERMARFQIQGDYLKEEVLTVNPGNAIDCAQDPDMQPGRTTFTQIKFAKERFHLYFQLGEEHLVYVFVPASLSDANL